MKLEGGLFGGRLLAFVRGMQALGKVLERVERQEAEQREKLG
jgi:hypothetical protein